MNLEDQAIGIKQEAENRDEIVNTVHIKSENADLNYGVRCDSIKVEEVKLDKHDESDFDIPKREHIWMETNEEVFEAENKKMKYGNAVDMDPVQLTGESDSNIESSMTIGPTYDSVLERIKTEQMEENWDEASLSTVTVDQIKMEDQPAVDVKCEKLEEEPNIDITKLENIESSELNEELDIKPESDPDPLSDSASTSALKTKTFEEDHPVVYRKTDEEFICYTCNYEARSKNQLIQHIFSNCSFTVGVKTENALYGHTTEKRSDISSSDSKGHSNTASSCVLVTCQHCKGTFKSKQIRDDHIIKEHPDFIASIRGKIHECSYCTYKTVFKHLFDQHNMRMHSSGELSPCQHCTATFKTESSLDAHIVKKHPDFMTSVRRKIYECSYCTYKTIHKHSFDRHMLIHSGGELSTCQHCNATFKSKYALDDHTVKQHPEFISSFDGRKVYECLNCTYKTINKHRFNEHTSTHSGVEPYKCRHCDAKFKKKHTLEDHIIQKHPDFIATVTMKVHECPHCTYKTTSKYKFNDHMMIHSISESSDALATCKHCTATFKTKYSLDDHILKKHQDLIESVSYKIHACPYCEYKTARKKDLNKHFLKHCDTASTSIPTTCKHCDMTYESKERLDIHIIKEHPDLVVADRRNIHECSYCTYKNTDKRLFNQHMLIHSGDTFSICQHCTDKFKNKNSLDDHILQKHPEFIASVTRKIHECSYCTYKTIYKYHLSQHIPSHFGDKLNTCSHCDATFTRKQALENHIVMKHPDFTASVTGKIHECLHCTFKTTFGSKFKDHMKIHSSGDCSSSSGKLLTCGYCNAIFENKYSLDDHVLKNHPEFSASVSKKIHACPHCEYKTNKKHILDRHLKKHSDAAVSDNLNACSHCDATFKKKQSLQSHIVKNHPDFIASVACKIYECSSCTYKTIRKDQLRKHTLKHS